MGKLYHDIDVIERTEITKEGRVLKVWRTSAYTASEVRFSMDIKEADFDEVKVDKILNEQAEKIEKIKAL